MKVDRNHPEIARTPSVKRYQFMSLKGDRRMYFTAAAVLEFRLEAGKYLHFDEQEGFWLFWQNNDPDGFRLHGAGDGALDISNNALVRLFRKKTRYTEGNHRFAIEKAGGIVNGFEAGRIITTKPIYPRKKQVR
jgi:hypothetical protein